MAGSTSVSSSKVYCTNFTDIWIWRPAGGSSRKVNICLDISVRTEDADRDTKRRWWVQNVAEKKMNESLSSLNVWLLLDNLGNPVHSTISTSRLAAPAFRNPSTFQVRRRNKQSCWSLKSSRQSWQHSRRARTGRWQTVRLQVKHGEGVKVLWPAEGRSCSLLRKSKWI